MEEKIGKIRQKGRADEFLSMRGTQFAIAGLKMEEGIQEPKNATRVPRNWK